MKNALKSALKRFSAPQVPRQLAANFRELAPAARAQLETSLREHYFTRPIWGEGITPQAYLDSEAGRKDLAAHIHGRLDVFRQTVIPWLDAAHPLEKATILEIGSGTGSSTIALAEQGAQVFAVDIDEPSLAVAKTRRELYGLENILFHRANATEIKNLFAQQRFDFIIFFACLEHMIHDERIQAMRDAWDMLPAGSLWSVVDTPNRLWYFDSHTAHLPFYFWLPDDLAFEYARFSPRQPFNASFHQRDDQAMLRFLRHGRGVSYHEFDLALGDVKELNVVSSLSLFLREQNPLWNLGRRLVRSPNHRFESFLMEVGPDIHPGFYQPSLDLIIRKS